MLDVYSFLMSTSHSIRSEYALLYNPIKTVQLRNKLCYFIHDNGFVLLRFACGFH